MAADPPCGVVWLPFAYTQAYQKKELDILKARTRDYKGFTADGEGKANVRTCCKVAAADHWLKPRVH